ncbi:MAG: 2-C-methyl-D-erythritol 2,4-cyclodiphosphate synthase [Thermoguttaceae bacterium]|nr:2-C-methyl-D-erythritol 2,4-cyclodiphosphate synthase [Thermoguttaceae bacterium]
MNTPFRVGIGHDTHRLIPGDGFRLGGIPIPHDKKLLGFSDADVLLHAVIDALLGAAAAGDIGDLFPDTDEKNRGRSSVEMLSIAWQKVQSMGWKLQNLDCIVFAQRPKLAGYKADIARNIAETLGVTPQQVNIKAKTGEGIGPVGEELVIEAQCVALLTGAQTVSDLIAKSLAASRPASVVPGVQVSPSIATPKAQGPIPNWATWQK